MHRISLIPLLAFMLFACGQQTTIPAPSNDGTTTPPEQSAQNDVIIPDTTKVADAATRAALTTYDSATGTMRFSQNSAALQNLKAGDVLVSEPSNAAPSGYLRKVQAVRQEGSEVVLDTTQARLDEAITEGELKADFQLSGDDLLRTEGLPKGVTVTANPANSLKPQAGVGENYSFNLNFDKTFVPIKGPNATGTIKVNGSVAFNVGYGVDVGVHVWSSPHLTFQASVGFAQSSHLNITGDFQGVVGDSVLIGTQYFKPTKPFFVGPIPVTFVPKVELYLTAGGEITAHVNFAASESVTAQVGARWTSSDGWKNISGFGITGSLPPPTFSGTLKPHVGMQSRASITLWDIAGPEATLEAGVNLDVAYPRNPNWIVNGFMKGTLGFRVKLPLLGTLASYNATIFDISKELGRSGNTPPVLALTNQPHSVDVGTPLNFRALCTASGPTFGNFEFYSVIDAEDGCLPIIVVSDREGLLTPDYTFTTPGTRTITVGTIDSQGATAKLAFTLNVVSPPPILTLTYTGDPHQGDPYSMAAVIKDSTEPAGGDLCKFTTWKVDAPDTVAYAPGCVVSVTFGAAGKRQVQVSTHNSYGAVTSQTVTLNVLPPLINLNPEITLAGVYNGEDKSFGFCAPSAVYVNNGAIIDLTLRSGTYCPSRATSPYFAEAAVHNPQNEVLSFDWKLIGQYDGKDTVFADSNQQTFNLHGPGSGYNAGPTTTACRVTLTVGAPDPSRSKSRTVWIGQCRYYTSRLA
ncbi:hypothetical protein EHF33_15365 [Deinococcus psychrotolerans]|uniref:Uncharacterized protein n=2 Tax=Deinococcus psychrotolerans TaxID=2489213 RepID=A0A3G8YG53_9DEIO|nr:hypothetical protein EHF33_15365 [Deinococcus psychrotolerans]